MSKFMFIGAFVLFFVGCHPDQSRSSSPSNSTAAISVARSSASTAATDAGPSVELQTPEVIFEAIAQDQAATKPEPVPMPPEFAALLDQNLAPNPEFVVRGQDIEESYARPGFALQATDESVNLSSYDSPVRDQGSRGTCAAFATTAAIENMMAQSPRNSSNLRYHLSVEHLWTLMGGAPTQVSTPVELARRNYLTGERQWPYGGVRSNSAACCGIGGYRATTNVTGALRAGNTLVLATATNQSWSGSSNGVIRINAAEWSGTIHGRHAVAIVGFGYQANGIGRYMIFKNSWGTGWGDNGYGYLPFSYCNTHACEILEITSLDVHW